MKPVDLTFVGYNGRHYFESTSILKCGKCLKLIGRRGQCYGYGYGYGRELYVCVRCHKRNYKRYAKCNPIGVFARAVDEPVKAL
jgi:hypothetical protein